MKLQFTKMQGCGNDYIYINCFDTQITNPQALSVFLSDRHFGVGSDGIVLILPSQAADAKMRMFNLDGSEGKMCGNAIRCMAKYLYDSGIVQKQEMHIETLSGIKHVTVFLQEGRVASACVNMGKAILAPAQIPVQLSGESIVARKAEIGGKAYPITCVSMGNPHCVVFCNQVDALALAEIGPLFETCGLFPEGINTEFVELVGTNQIKMRVWERGSGETLACGTGACASAVAAVLSGHCDKNADIHVALLGGALTVRYTDDGVWMTGECKKVFDGTVEM